MELSVDYFKELQKSIQKNSLLVEKIKLGDVMFAIESKKLSIQQLIQVNEEWLVEAKNKNQEELAEICQAKIEAYKVTLDLFDDMYANIKKLSI